MTAVLHTPDYKVHQLERVDFFSMRREKECRIVFSDIPENADFFTNNDPSLDVRILQAPNGGQTGPVQSIIALVSAKDGLSKLQVRDTNDALLKEWVIEVFSDEASSLKPSGPPAISQQ